MPDEAAISRLAEWARRGNRMPIDPEDSLPPPVDVDCHPPDDLDPTNPNLSREEWAETRTCQVCGIAGEDVSAARRCASCEKFDIMPESRWQREHPECL